MTNMASNRAAKRPRKRSPTRSGRPPGQLSEDTRERILVAARGCFIRLGFERATNQQIASAAGITAAALYRYFASKAEIYAAVVKESSESQASWLRKTIAAEPTVVAAFGAVLRSLGDGSASAAARFMAGVATEMQRHPEIAHHMTASPGELETLWRELVAGGVRRREISPENAEAALAFMFSSMIGIVGYMGAVGREKGEPAVAGLLQLLEGRLFHESSAPARKRSARSG